MKRQRHILRVLSSIFVGIMAFCITLPILLLLGGILLGPSDSEDLIPPELATLFLISIMLGLVVGVLVSVKYYRYLGKQK